LALVGPHKNLWDELHVGPCWYTITSEIHKDHIKLLHISRRRLILQKVEELDLIKIDNFNLELFSMWFIFNEIQENMLWL